jgi:hypothetical protein
MTRLVLQRLDCCCLEQDTCILDDASLNPISRRPTQYFVQEHALHIAQECLINFLAFHIAKQIEAIPKVKTLLPLGKVLLIHLQYCSGLHGMSLISQ